MTLANFLVLMSIVVLWITYDQLRRLSKLYGSYIPEFMKRAEAPNAKAILSTDDYNNIAEKLQIYALRAILFLIFATIALVSNTAALALYPEFNNAILKTAFVMGNGWVLANIFLSRNTFNYVYWCESRITAMVIEDKAAKHVGKATASKQDIADYLAHENEELEKEMKDADFDDEDRQEPPEK